MQKKFRLQKWSITNDFYKNYHACGNVYNNPKFHKGKFITTSAILNIAEKNNTIIIHTFNSVYELALDSYTGTESILNEFKNHFKNLSDKMFEISKKLLSVGDSLICSSNMIYSSESNGLVHLIASKDKISSDLIFEYPEDNFKLRCTCTDFENYYIINEDNSYSAKSVLYDLNLKECSIKKYDYKSITDVITTVDIFEQSDIFDF